MPKIIEKLAYEYNELSDKAKEQANHWYACNVQYHWLDDHIEGVKRFLELFGITLTEWSIDYCQYSYETDIDECKFQSIDKKRVEKLLSGFVLCYCADETILASFKEAHKKHGSVKLAIEYALEKSFDELQSDYVNHYEDESIEDFYTSNEYLFDEKGHIL